MSTILKRKVISVVILLGLMVTGLYGWYWWQSQQWRVTTDNAYVRADISSVGAEITGIVEQVLMKDNQYVQQGELLVTIDQADYRARLERAEAAVLKAKSQLRHLQKRIHLQRALIDEAQANRDAALAEHERSRKALKRSDRLVTKGWVSEQQYDTAESSLSVARAKVARAEAALSARERQQEVLEAEIAQVEAQILDAQITKRLAAIDLEDTQIRAPISGIIGNRKVQEGELVRAGTTLAAVVPLEELWISANFKETQLQHIRKGLQAHVAIDAYPDTPMLGVVDSLAPASRAEFSLLPADNATGNFTKVVQRLEVKILLKVPPQLAQRIRPGMSAEVTIDLNPSRELAAHTTPARPLTVAVN